MKKEFFETLVKNSEMAREPVDVSFGDLYELNQCVNAFDTLLQEFSSNMKTNLTQEFWEGITLIQVHMENALDKGILECQKSKR